MADEAVGFSLEDARRIARAVRADETGQNNPPVRGGRSVVYRPGYSAIVLVTDTTEVSDRFPGTIQRYDPVEKTFEELGDCWVVGANHEMLTEQYYLGDFVGEANTLPVFLVVCCADVGDATGTGEGGGGSGGSVITDACPDGMPETLYATLSGGTGGASTLNGSVIEFLFLSAAPRPGYDSYYNGSGSSGSYVFSGQIETEEATPQFEIQLGVDGHLTTAVEVSSYTCSPLSVSGTATWTTGPFAGESIDFEITT